MSRIGKKPIPLPDKIKVAVNGSEVIVENGPARLSYSHPPEVSVSVDTQAKQVVVERRDNDRRSKAMHGLTRALIANMITGVSTGFIKELDVNGVGWTVKVAGKQIALNIGYADTRKLDIPSDVTVQIQGSRIKVSGCDKQAVGQMAARIRAQRPPEPYNGKGIKYVDEKIIRKVGKALAGSGA